MDTPARPVISGLRQVITRRDFQDGRSVLMERARQLTAGTSKVELWLSGGVDSATILFALLAIGVRPRCLTFTVGDARTPDVKVATEMTWEFRLEHEIVSIPRTSHSLLRDICTVMSYVDWSVTSMIRKVIIQTVHPTLYLYKASDADVIINGLDGDTYFRTSKEEVMATHRMGERAVSHFRSPKSDDPDGSTYHITDVGRRKFGRNNVDFYGFDAWGAWIQQFGVKATNKPVQKWAAVGCFDEYWCKGGWYRTNSPYQIGSGLREFHDTLLSDPAVNPHKHLGIIAVYNEIARKMGVKAGSNYRGAYPHGKHLDWSDFREDWGRNAG